MSAKVASIDKIKLINMAVVFVSFLLLLAGLVFSSVTFQRK